MWRRQMDKFNHCAFCGAIRVVGESVIRVSAEEMRQEFIGESVQLVPNPISLSVHWVMG